MNDSRQSQKAKAAAESLGAPVNLPDGSAFTSQSVKVGISEIIALSQKLLPISNSRPDFIERKKAAAIPVGFTL
jgi:hypothetical protein